MYNPSDSSMQSTLRPNINTNWFFDTPWIGPCVRQASGGYFEIHVLSSPKYGNGMLLLIPVSHVVEHEKNRYKRCEKMKFLDSYKLEKYMDPSENSSSIDWLTEKAPISIEDKDTDGWLAIVAYNLEQTVLEPWDKHDSTMGSGDRLPWGSPFHELAVIKKFKFRLDQWLAKTTADLSLSFIGSADIQKWNTLPRRDFNFILGSCQYPAGLLDKRMAEQSLNAIADGLQLNDEINTKASDFVIFAGDQIYSDATAGLLDPTRSDERLDMPYEAAFRAKYMRQIMSKIPVHMLPDDHEITDNYEPVNDKNSVVDKRQKRQLVDGLQAYWKYQRLEPVQLSINDTNTVRAVKILGKVVSYTFDHGCAAFYMLDTRTKREFREIGKPDTAKMFGDQELETLLEWLLKNKDKIKFIVTPSMLFPRNLGALNSGVDHASRADSWEGYPRTMHQIFLHILDHNIKNTVFLSGDEHMCCYASIELSSQIHARKSKIASVHASGLYAPYPFANAKKEDFVQGIEIFDLNGITCQVTATYVEDSQFARIRVNQPPLNMPTVVVEFCNAVGAKLSTLNLL